MKHISHFIVIACLIFTVPARAGEESRDLKSRLLKTVWIWANNETIVFLPNSKIRWKNNIATDLTAWRWSVSDREKLTVEGIGVWKHHYKIVFEPDLKTGILYEEDCPPRPTQKVEKEQRGKPGR
jgi:hypothetical protein